MTPMTDEAALAVLSAATLDRSIHESRSVYDAAVAHLAARIAELEAELARVRRAAKMGMDAAHNIAAHDLALGRRMQAESKPEAVASEREANSILTEMLDSAEARATRAEAELARCREALTAIRDSTFRSAVTLRGMADRAINSARGVG